MGLYKVDGQYLCSLDICLTCQPHWIHAVRVRCHRKREQDCGPSLGLRYSVPSAYTRRIHTIYEKPRNAALRGPNSVPFFHAYRKQPRCASFRAGGLLGQKLLVKECADEAGLGRGPGRGLGKGEVVKVGRGHYVVIRTPHAFARHFYEFPHVHRRYTSLADKRQLRKQHQFSTLSCNMSLTWFQPSSLISLRTLCK